jgi:choline-sulfatase
VQLFNLQEDPKELNDRAADPGCRAVLDELTTVILDGWDPDAVWARIQEKIGDQEMLTSWARRVNPPETHRWPLRPEMDYLA